MRRAVVCRAIVCRADEWTEMTQHTDMTGTEGNIMSAGIIAVIVICSVIGAILVALILALVILCSKKPNKNRPEHIDNSNGYVKASGTNLYDGDGNLMWLRGVNFGDWFVQESWMTVSGIGDFETGWYTQQRGLDAMHTNPNLTEEQIRDIREMYIQNYITEEDFVRVASMGMNCVRLPFTYRNFEGMDGFKYLDWALDMCEKYHIYAIVDLHGAYGSQNMDDHSGDDVSYNLFGNEENMAKTVKLWETIAARYKDRKIIAGYDLLNEPRKAPHKFGGRRTFDFYDRLYKAVRAIDSNHMIIMECFTFPIHGARLKHYNWTNICIQYHIYNFTPFPQQVTQLAYKAMHNFMGFKAPVYVGEFCIFTNEKEWNIMLDWLQKTGWSYTSWTYKTNAYQYQIREKYKDYWGIFELNMPPVDLHTATYDEIAEKYSCIGTENATPSGLYNVYMTRLNKDNDKG